MNTPSQNDPLANSQAIPAYDVAVIGGGTAGAIAAIQSARLGAKTVIIERSGVLGGTVTLGGVAAPSYFHAGSKQVISGIGWEAVTRTMDLDGSPLPDFAKPHPTRPSHPVFLNWAVLSLILEEMAIEAGVEIRYHEFPTRVVDDGDSWVIQSFGHNCQAQLRATELIDCTGGADVVGQLGFEREYSEERQPGTLIFRLAGYDVDALDENEIQHRYDDAIASGLVRPGDFWQHGSAPFLKFLRQRGSNAIHVQGADGSTSEKQTAANLAGRAVVLRMLRFVKSLPGCENVKIERLHTETAVRETHRIVGETRVTRDDYVTGRLFPDAVAYSYYFIDIHTHHGVVQEFLAPGVIPTIPFGSLVPKGSRRLLVAGRSISSDRDAHSALRVQSSCMAMGQAAGAAAALGSRQGVASRDVGLDHLRRTLEAEGALVPPKDAVA